MIVLLSAFSLYSNTFNCEWSYDDFPVIVDNPDSQSLHQFFNNNYPVRPLRELTFIADYQFFGLNPPGYHIQHVFWHGLNAFLLFLLAGELGASRRSAWLAAFLFLAHPLQVEVVANISHRKESLALAFCLLSLLAWLRGRRDNRWDSRWLVIAGLLCGVAVLGKENALLLPAVVVGYELLFRGGWVVLWRRNRLLIILTLAVVCGAGWLVLSRYVIGKDVAWVMSAWLPIKAELHGDFSIAVYYATILKSWFFIWSRLVWPQNLAIEYYMPSATGFGDPQTLAALAIVTLLVAGMGLAWRRLPVVAFGLGWFLLFWLPTSNFIPLVYLAADRYMYIPSAGALLAMAVLLDRWLKDVRLYRCVAIALVLTLAVISWQQNKVWLTVESLWTQAIKVSPHASVSLNYLGNYYLVRGNLLGAKDLYEQSVKFDPTHPAAYYNLGLIYDQVGMEPLAKQNYQEFLRLATPEFKTQADALRQRLGE